MSQALKQSTHLFADEEYTPRIIVWQLSDVASSTSFSKHETLLTIESIARTGRPIVVLTGDSVLKFPDIYEVIEYGFALGLKMIIEAPPQDITMEVMKTYSVFGKKIFRIIVDDCITENSETRFQETRELQILRDCIRRMRQFGFEIHFSITIHTPDIRKLAYYHDYAFRSRADGLYCHLRFDKLPPQNGANGENHEITKFIKSIATMKGFSPKQMYFSPQCVKYSYSSHSHTMQDADSAEAEWNHSCLAGKTFAFITSDGKVHLCEGMQFECGNLRDNGFDFKEIWNSSEQFCRLRADQQSCEDTRSYLSKTHTRQLPTTDV